MGLSPPARLGDGVVEASKSIVQGDAWLQSKIFERDKGTT